MHFCRDSQRIFAGARSVQAARAASEYYCLTPKQHANRSPRIESDPLGVHLQCGLPDTNDNSERNAPLRSGCNRHLADLDRHCRIPAALAPLVWSMLQAGRLGRTIRLWRRVCRPSAGATTKLNPQEASRATGLPLTRVQSQQSTAASSVSTCCEPPCVCSWVPQYRPFPPPWHPGWLSRHAGRRQLHRRLPPVLPHQLRRRELLLQSIPVFWLSSSGKRSRYQHPTHRYLRGMP